MFGNQKQLIFLYDRVMDKTYRNKLMLPLHFISYGYINAKLYEYNEYYKHYKRTVIAVPNDAVKRKWGNDKVFGGIFLLDYYSVTIRTLDGLYGCSKARLGQNNRNDLMHRVSLPINTIEFNSLDELGRGIYVTKDTFIGEVYLGNIEHHLIRKRIETKRHRIIYGIDTKHFKKMYIQEGGE